MAEEEVGPGQDAEIGTPGVRAQPAGGAVLGRAPGPRRCGAVRLGIVPEEASVAPLELSQSPPSGNRTRVEPVPRRARVSPRSLPGLRSRRRLRRGLGLWLRREELIGRGEEELEEEGRKLLSF